MEKKGLVKRILALLAALVICISSVPVIRMEAAEVEAEPEGQMQVEEPAGQNVQQEIVAEDDTPGTDDGAVSGTDDDDAPGTDDDDAPGTDDDDAPEPGENEPAEHALCVTYDKSFGSVVVRELQTDLAVELSGEVTDTGLKFGLDEGKKYEIVIAADTGYEIETFEVNGTVQADVGGAAYTYTIESPEASVVCNISFREMCSEIAVQVAGQGSIVYRPEDGEEVTYTSENAGDEVPGSLRTASGMDVEFYLVPGNNCYISGVKIDGTDISVDDASVELQPDGTSWYTFPEIQGVHSIQVTFSQIEEQYLVKETAETVEEMLARGNVQISFSRNTDSSKVSERENQITYILTHHEKAVISAREDALCGYEIQNGGQFVTSYEIAESASRLMSQYVIRRTKGTWEGSVVRYITGYEWNFVIDNNKPELEIDGESQVWLSGKETNLEITGKASDQDTGIAKVVWYTEEKDISAAADEIVQETTNVVRLRDGEFVVEVGAAPAEDVTYYIYAVDGAENIQVASLLYRVDTEGPSVSVQMEKDTSFWDKFFWNREKIAVTVTADDADGSGVESVTLMVNGEEMQTKAYEGSACVFTVYLKENEDCTITAVATDKVGNRTGKPADGGTVWYDNELPTAKITPQGEVYLCDGILYSQSEVKMCLQVSDADSGLAGIEVKINDKIITEDWNGKEIGTAYTSLMQQTFSDDFEISTAQGQPDANGGYKVAVTVKDAAGNSVTQNFQIYQDETAPEVTAIQVTGKNAAGEDIAVEGTGTAGTASSDIYGYYAADTLYVKVSTTDGTNGAGVKEIVYALQNADGAKGAQGTALVDSEGWAALAIPADFKGNILVKAKDYVGNVTSEYRTTDHMIAETAEMFQGDGHIVMTAPAASAKDSEGNDLYAEDVTIPVVVTDTYAGIRSITWNVTLETDQRVVASGEVLVDHAGNSSVGNWQVTKRERNLATGVAGTIPVTENSNHIIVNVTMTNRAGYVTTESMTLSIDKTAPTVEISFDSEQGDDAYPDYYAKDRTATITIKERNFSEAGVRLAVANTDGSIPSISGWTSAGGASDETTYTAKLVFDADGDYTVSMQYTDLAGNVARAFEEQKFTIDKTQPEIEVSFDREQGTNGNYFAEERTATIRVREHNFDADRVEITGTAADNGNGIAFPVISGWRTAGDEHTTTITFDRDGAYSFEVHGLDKAGNKAEDVIIDPYYIDLTDPVIEIAGVEDMSANNGTVQPIIQIMDTNYSPGDVEIQLVGANRGPITPEGTFAAAENGQTFRFNDFAREQEVDDIYTLTATETDMAGNTVTETITFSVNRFGSVYTLEGGLEEIAGSYIKNPVDILLTETNVDALEEDTIKVVLSTNGTPRTLERGSDYSLTRSGGKGSWNQYQYELYKKNFAGDGTYKVTVYSVDAAGNINETVDETKKAEITFGVDGTAPVIVPLNIEDGGNYDTDQLKASVSVQDNLVLESVTIMRNGETVDYENSGDTYAFVIPEDSSRQSVVVLAEDAAGNAVTCEVTELLVSTNALVRWYNNKPVFAATLAGTGVAVGGAGAAVGFRRKNYIRLKRK